MDASGSRVGRRWSRRWALWMLLVALLVGLLSTLVWLAGRYEASQLQSRLEQDAAQMVTDIRAELTRNVQSFQALQANSPSPEAWRIGAAELLHENREMMRLEWRDVALGMMSYSETSYRSSVFERLGRDSAQSDVGFACAAARRFSGPAYSISYFLPQSGGLGLEVLDMCMPVLAAGRLSGYLVATYSLPDILSELVGRQLGRGQGLAFTEADGTRLAMYGNPTRGSQAYVAQQLLDLPGNTLVLRLESRRGTPDLFPNLLTALVTAMTMALVAVLALLGRDMRRRLKVEHDLADALAFRKAMEDSLVTGMRARDLQGRVTYVNPAFCQMVGLEARELLGLDTPPPYWPPEQVEEYGQRQASRLAVGVNLPREGFESVFMRRDGSRFPVLIIEAPLINAVGKQTGWMSAILDVSEQRRVEELSRASQDRLQATARLATVGEMASLLSHELNQPLAAISSYATGSLNLLQSAATDARQPSSNLDLQLAMRRIAEQAERAGKVIKSVHDFVRRREQVREHVAPRALLDAVMPLVSLQARKLGVQVLMQVEASCGPVLCDRTMVEQVLLNLARNGMQAMQGLDKSGRAGKVLTLRVRPAASNAYSRWVEFAVIDHGEGIPEKVAQQLFTPFFTTKAEGMGLGLSLCRTVIEQHGGFLGFDAASPQGTIFTFTLPEAVTSGASADAAVLLT
ncbi:nitrogen regulation protein NR(II) [Polaromonas sp.]|uniref:two-component system sensor histidine kinase NtrB n=1 Tax=Polaromonas sp. TaxID=1869339 RepID=UPI003568E1FC